ncbi:BsaT protein [Burkholderia pyrrocinia]
MKQLSDAKRILALLQRRSLTLRQKMQRLRDALSSLDLRILENRTMVERLREKLAQATPPKAYAHRDLMRARGKQATIRFEIACKKTEEEELLDRRRDVEQELSANKDASLALEQRQNKHRDWFARRSLEYDLLRESLAEAEITEGRGHGFINQC